MEERKELEKLKLELDCYKKIVEGFGKLWFMEEDFQINYKGETIDCKNIIGPVKYYQKNARQFMYEKNGEFKIRELRYKPNKLKPIPGKCVYVDRRQHKYTKCRQPFIYSESVNFKQYGIIQTTYCKHINTQGQSHCEFCNRAWKFVKTSLKNNKSKIKKQQQYI